VALIKNLPLSFSYVYLDTTSKTLVYVSSRLYYKKPANQLLQRCTKTLKATATAAAGKLLATKLLGNQHTNN